MSNSNSLKINNQKSVFNPDTQTIRDGIHTYSLTEIPEENSPWVQEAREGILSHIDLGELINDLTVAVDLIYLAVNGAKDDALGIDLDNLQKDVLTLFSASGRTMFEFREKSRLASVALRKAFIRLMSGKEQQAKNELDAISRIALDMQKEANDIAGKYKSFSITVRGASSKLQLRVITEGSELQELRKINDSLNANLHKHQSTERQLNILIDELIEDIEEAKATVKDEETKAFWLQLMGGLFNAVGAGLGAYSMSNNPAAMISKVSDDVTKSFAAAEATVEKAKEKLGPEQQKELDEKIAAQKKAEVEKNKKDAEVKDLEKQVDNIKEDVKKQEDIIKKEKAIISTAKKEIKENKGDEDKKAASKNANDMKEFAEDAISDAKKTLKTKGKRKKAKESDLQKAKEEFEAAERKWKEAKAAVDGFAEGFKSLGNAVNGMGDKAEARAATARDTMNEILRLKRDAQKEKRAATSEIQKLLVKMEANLREGDQKKNLIYCLEISIWALSNLFVTFEKTSFFWENIAKAAAKLAEPKIQGMIQDIIDNEAELQDRIKIYKGDDFVRMSIPTVVNWSALGSICWQYDQEMQTAVQKVEKNIGSALGSEEAKRKLGTMKSDLEARLSYINATSEKKEAELAAKRLN